MDYWLSIVDDLLMEKHGAQHLISKRSRNNMKTNSFRTWDDLVFENRNHLYGAFVLRRAYPARVLLGFGITAAFVWMLLNLAQPGSIPDVVMKPPVYKDPGIKLSEYKLPERQRQETHEPQRRQGIRDDIPPLVVSDLAEIETPDSTEYIPGDENEGIIGTDVGDGDLTGGEGTGTEVDSDDDSPRPGAEIMPSFPGGNAAMMKFIRKKIRYPKSAENIGVSGTVYVSFVIGRDGKVRDVSVLRGFHPACDKEAVRVVELLPAWSSGMQNGRPVSVKMVLPIKFEAGK